MISDRSACGAARRLPLLLLDLDDNEIDWADDTCEDGGLVEVLDSRMRYQGTGFSTAAPRSRCGSSRCERGETIDRAFWERRIRAAWENRQALGFFERMPRHFRRAGWPARSDGGQIRRLSVVPDRLARYGAHAG